MTGIGFEHSQVFLPSVNIGLVRRFPSQRFEVLGKVENANESEYMGFQALQARVVEGFDGGFLDRAAHAPGLPVRLRAIGLCQLVSNTGFIANLAKDMHSPKGMDGVFSALE